MSARQATDLDKRVGQAVRDQRLAKGLSQSDLGNAIGRTFQQVQKYERGSNRIAIGTLVRIAGALECPVTHFLNVADSPIDISAEELRLLTAWRRLQPHQRAAVRNVISAISDTPQPTV